jgi:hypothetical protein
MTNKHTATLAVILVCTLHCIACEKKNELQKEQKNEPQFTDPRDNKTYKTIKIGEQVWFAENLNYAAEGSKCYDNEPANCQKYGRLYNWNMAITACPKDGICQAMLNGTGCIVLRTVQAVRIALTKAKRQVNF